MSSSLWPHGPKHTRIPCPSLSPGVCSNSCPLNQWCHPTISSSVATSSSPQTFPASGSFPVSQLLASGGQSIGTSASATVFPVNIQGLISFRMDWFDLLAVWRTPKSLLQHHSLKASILWYSVFFMVQLSHLHMTIEKPCTFVSKEMSAFYYAV